MKKQDPELWRTACFPLGTEHLWHVKADWAVPQDSILSTERRGLLGKASTRSKSKIPSAGLMHGKHLQVLFLGSWCKELSFARN